MNEFNIGYIGPAKQIKMLGFDGFETFKIDDVTIGIRPKWISVKDEFPENGHYVLAFDGSDIFIVKFNRTSRAKKIEGYFSGSCECEDFNEITHWIPLPHTPKWKEND